MNYDTLNGTIDPLVETIEGLEFILGVVSPDSIVTDQGNLDAIINQMKTMKRTLESELELLKDKAQQMKEIDELITGGSY